MPLTLADLRTPTTRARALQFLITSLGALGFNSGSWHQGSKQHTFLRLMADWAADFTHSVKFIAELAYNELATGNALTEFSRSHYDNERIGAIKTKGPIKLTDGAGTGPHVITVGQLVVSDINNGFTYRNIAGGTIPLSGQVDLVFEAEVAGASRNVLAGTISNLQTPIAGVLVNNPATPPAVWYTTAGADEESDEALRARNRTKWALLSIAVPGDGYVNLALGVAGITRVALDDQNPDGANSLRVYIATGSGVPSAPQISDVQAAIDARKAVTAVPLALSASPTTVTFAGNIYVRGSLNTSTKQTAIKDALKAFIDTFPIGGNLAANEIPLSEIVTAISSIFGVEKVELSSPSASVGLGPFNVAITDTGASMSGLAFISV